MEELRNDIAIKQRRRLPFIIASVVIWFMIFLVSVLDINIQLKNY